MMARMHAVRTIHWGSLCLALVVAHSEARAADCTATPTPACHLELGKKLMKTDPKRAATELLASYKLDERTDTLELYASALELDKQYALAFETWERVITYRGSEQTAAKEQKKPAVAARAKRQADAAAVTTKKLEAKIARVRVKFAAGPKPTVTRDGVEVDATKEIIVKADNDELVFTAKDGSVDKRTLVIKAGENVRIDYPDPAKAPPPPVDPPKVEQPKVEQPKVEQPKVEQPKVEPKPDPVIVTKRDPSLTHDGRPGKNMSRMGVAFVGGGVILAGVATTYGILASRDFDKAKDAGCNSDAECPVGSAGIDLVDQSNHRARIAQITAIGAVALVGTGVTLWFMGRSKERRAQMSLQVAPSSATLAWRF
jgi:hypothetical protein